jgi:putative phage-type endonuclease
MTEALTQGSDEWLQARLGKVTASRIADVMAKTKTGYSTSRKNYCVELALERIKGSREESFTNAAMAWGTEQEPLARAAYESHTGEIVDEVGLVMHPTMAMCAASPDGLVGDDGLIEIKNPNSATHIETIFSGKPDGKYVYQMAWQMACTGRKWADFVSYDSRLPDYARLFIKRIPRDDALIAEIEQEVSAFLKEVDAMVNKIESRRP